MGTGEEMFPAGVMAMEPLSPEVVGALSGLPVERLPLLELPDVPFPSLPLPAIPVSGFGAA
jgi:hypothetical protein